VRPYVICHMCTTIDGKILGNRWGKLPGGKDSAMLFETTADRFGVGAWIVGTTTMKEFAGRNVKLPPAKTPVERGDHVADAKAESFAIGADAKGVLRFQNGDVDGDHVVLLVTEQVSNDYLAHLQKAGVSYLICGKHEIDLPVALDKLRHIFGIKKLMLEGGGKFNGSMLKAGLVDEISQVVVPVADGGAGISSIFDIPGEAPKRAAAALRLIKQQKLPGGVNWFRYRVIGKPRSAQSR
jgi:2,5-diamino-6-(ribosylamino)-4(3H)-pyrimidinone 5'-phosphate reductase